MPGRQSSERPLSEIGVVIVPRVMVDAAEADVAAPAATISAVSVSDGQDLV